MAATNVPILYQRNVNQDLYVYALASTYKSNWRVYDPDYALSRDPDIFERVRRDPVIAHAFEQRLHMIAGKVWRVEPRGDTPQDKLAAKIMEEIIDSIEHFTESRYELAQAVIVARTYQYMEGDRKFVSLGGLPAANWWMPIRLHDIDRRRFKFRPNWTTGKAPGDNKLDVTMELYSIERGKWESVDHPEWFIRHVYGDEEARLGHGRGLLEAIYFYHWAKGVVLREGLEGIERWAQGIVTAKIDGLVPGSKDRTNEDVRDTWLDIIQKMRSRHALVYGKDDEFKVVESTGTGHQMVLEFVKYLDEGITRLILGSISPSGQSGREGSYAKSKVEQDTTEALIQYDRKLLDETITRDLVGAIWRLNKPIFSFTGMACAKMPRLVTVQERNEDPHLAVQVIARALMSGIPLRKDEVYSKIGFSMPNPEDEVIEGVTPMLQQMADGTTSNIQSREFERSEGGQFAPKGRGFTEPLPKQEEQK